MKVSTMKDDKSSPSSCPFDSEGTKVSKKERKWWPFDQVVKMDIQFFYTKEAKGKSLRRRTTLLFLPIV